MILKQLKLQSFRNYKEKTFDFNRVTIFVGPNGIGKTNILEAILLLSTTRSHRARKDSEMILWGQDLARIRGILDDNELLLVLTKTGKVAKEKGVEKRLSKFLGIFKSILFYPEEISAIAGSPAARRRILDMVLCQIDHKYTHDLLEYQKVIHQRNELLGLIRAGFSNVEELFFWDKTLSKIGARIEEKRLAAFDFINKKISLIFGQFNLERGNFKLEYHPTFKLGNQIAQGFLQALEKTRDKEIRFGQTIIGPHRSDLIFMLDNKPLASFGSRGELRSALLAFKVALLELMEKETGQKPILLLDDIFSELDKKRRLALSKLITNMQTVITTTDVGNLDKEFVRRAKIVELQ